MHGFREGDVVRVKCGGPDMDVLCVTPDYPFSDGPAPAVFCVWDAGMFRFEQAYPLCAIEQVWHERRKLNVIGDHNALPKGAIPEAKPLPPANDAAAQQIIKSHIRFVIEIASAENEIGRLIALLQDKIAVFTYGPELVSKMQRGCKFHEVRFGVPPDLAPTAETVNLWLDSLSLDRSLIFRTFQQELPHANAHHQ